MQVVYAIGTRACILVYVRTWISCLHTIVSKYKLVRCRYELYETGSLFHVHACFMHVSCISQQLQDSRVRYGKVR